MLLALSEIRQAGGKTVVAYAAEHDLDPATEVSNEIEINWPPRSDRRLTIPEIDEARWFDLADARRQVPQSQASLLDRPVDALEQLSRGGVDR